MTIKFEIIAVRIKGHRARALEPSGEQNRRPLGCDQYCGGIFRSAAVISPAGKMPISARRAKALRHHRLNRRVERRKCEDHKAEVDIVAGEDICGKLSSHRPSRQSRIVQ